MYRWIVVGSFLQRALRPLACGALGAALIAPAPAGAGTHHRQSCLPPGALVIATDGAVWVYRRSGRLPAHEGVYACVRGQRKPAVLVAPSRHCCSSVSRVAFAGTRVAYANDFHGVDSGCTNIGVVDVVSRRRLLELVGVGCSTDAGFISLGEVTDLVVESRGSVAWIIAKGNRRAPRFEVDAAKTSGVVTVLDPGPNVTPGSLRLVHKTASWQDAGQPRSAALP